MSRYIDADALVKSIERRRLVLKHTITVPDALAVQGRIVREEIEIAPTADVVEVVRCKDCKFWGITHAQDVEKSHYCCRDNMWCMPLRFADDYCSCGKRREDNDNSRTN